MLSFPSKNRVKIRIRGHPAINSEIGHRVPMIALLCKAKVGYWHQHPGLKVSLLMLQSLKLGFNYVYLPYV